jgi:hypothetical protein
MTADEIQTTYLFALLIAAHCDCHDELADNDLYVVGCILGRPDAGKSITKPQLDYLADVAGRAGLDPSKLDFREQWSVQAIDRIG